jgi:methionine sulfoxide reductase heme-binding subunit
MSLAYSGYSAAILLAICLAVSPFSQNFPTILLPRILNRHKREFGLSSFFYAALHVLSYFMRKVLKMGFFEWKSLLRLYLIPGEIAFLVLLTLALTSDPFWIKKLGWQKWKSIHRTVYIAEAGIFLHLCLNSSQKAFWGFAIFLPLFILQRLRLQK